MHINVTFPTDAYALGCAWHQFFCVQFPGRMAKRKCSSWNARNEIRRFENVEKSSNFKLAFVYHRSNIFDINFLCDSFHQDTTLGFLLRRGSDVTFRRCVALKWYSSKSWKITDILKCRTQTCNYPDSFFSREGEKKNSARDVMFFFMGRSPDVGPMYFAFPGTSTARTRSRRLREIWIFVHLEFFKGPYLAIFSFLSSFIN